jgi:hypothetical protein
MGLRGVTGADRVVMSGAVPGHGCRYFEGLDTLKIGWIAGPNRGKRDARRSMSETVGGCLEGSMVARRVMLEVMPARMYSS